MPLCLCVVNINPRELKEKIEDVKKNKKFEHKLARRNKKPEDITSEDFSDEELTAFARHSKMEDLAATLADNDGRLKKFAEKELKTPVRQKAIEMIHQMELADEEIDAAKDELQKPSILKQVKDREIAGFKESELLENLRKFNAKKLKEVFSDDDFLSKKFGDDFDKVKELIEREMKNRERDEKYCSYIENLEKAENITELESRLTEVMKDIYGTDFVVKVKRDEKMLSKFKSHAKTLILMLKEYNVKYHKSIKELHLGYLLSGDSDYGEVYWTDREGESIKYMSIDSRGNNNTVVHEFIHSVFVDKEVRIPILLSEIPEVRERKRHFYREMLDLSKRYFKDVKEGRTKSLIPDESDVNMNELLAYVITDHFRNNEGGYSEEIMELFDSYFKEDSLNFKTDEDIKNLKN